MAFPLAELPGFIRYSVPGSPKGSTQVAGDADFRLVPDPLPYPRYLMAFERVIEHLKKGNSYLVNLTFPTPIDTNLTLAGIYNLSEAPYKLLYDDRFVVFSPESFIRIHDGWIRSYPMKGTIDASVPDAAEKVLNDPKESAEHNTIVDLIRNDLSRVADRVEVARFRYIERIRTLDREILQVSSEIRGRLADGYREHLGELLDSLLPAGSVSGAPKKRTVEIIREVESGPRGFYTGIFGIFDGKDVDSAVMIRFIEKTPSGLVYRSGGGITHLSDPVSEYREMLDKVYLQISKK